MNYSKIIKFDTGNSHGISTTLFVSGCNNCCTGCHNPQSWDKDYGEEFDSSVALDLITSLNNPHIKYLVLSGGDPLFESNTRTIVDLIYDVRTFAPNIKIILYTGLTIEQILESDDPVKHLILRKIDYLIDGKYDETKKSSCIDLRGSVNQRCFKRNKISGTVCSKFEDISDEYFKEKTYHTTDQFKTYYI